MPSSRAVLCPACGRAFTEGELFCPYDRSPLPAQPQITDDALINTTIEGRYTILERLGVGGMGVVYKALQHRLNRHVALKLLMPRFGEDPSAADRFRIEALAASQLTSSHTVSIYDFGSAEDGSLFIAMQLLEGESLRSRLQRGPLPAREAVMVAQHVCESLAEAHERPTPILHRDIKPDNIFIRGTTQGQVHATVLDFGLARFADTQRMRLTSANIALGTPAYMSPEQCRANSPIDGRSDLYAVGIVLYEMLAGRPPFDSPDPASMLFKHAYEKPPALDETYPGLVVPPLIERFMASLLEKLPENRPESSRIASAKLHEILEQLPRLAPLPVGGAGQSTAPDLPGLGDGGGSATARGRPLTPVGATPAEIAAMATRPLPARITAPAIAPPRTPVPALPTAQFPIPAPPGPISAPTPTLGMEFETGAFVRDRRRPSDDGFPMPTLESRAPTLRQVAFMLLAVAGAGFGGASLYQRLRPATVPPVDPPAQVVAPVVVRPVFRAPLPPPAPPPPAPATPPPPPVAEPAPAPPPKKVEKPPRKPPPSKHVATPEWKKELKL